MHPYPRYRHMLWLPKTFSVSGKCDYSVDKEGVDRRPGTFWIRDILYSLNVPCNLSRVRVYRSLFAAANLLCTFSSCFSLAFSCIDPPWGRFRTVLNPADVCQLWGKCQTAILRTVLSWFPVFLGAFPSWSPLLRVKQHLKDHFLRFNTPIVRIFRTESLSF
jgi:hypothetical protein